MRASGQGGRELRFQQRAFRDSDVDQVVIAVVEQNLWVEHHDHVDAEEHPHHVLVQQEVDRAVALGIGPGEIQHHLAVLAPHGAADLVGAVAQAVVADVVLEADRRFADGAFDQGLHGAVIAGQKLLAGGDEHVVPEPLAHLDHPARGDAASGDQGVQVRLAPFGRAGLVHDQLDQVFVVDPLLPDLHRRDAHPLLEDRTGVDRHGARHLAADVGLVPEHGGVGDQPPVLEHRQQHQPVVAVADGALHRIGVGEEDHVPLLHRAVIAVEERVDVGAELPDHHAALGIADQGKGVALLADAGGHGGADQRGVHLHPRVAQRVFNDVEGDWIDRDLGKGRLVGLDDLSAHDRLRVRPG